MIIGVIILLAGEVPPVVALFLCVQFLLGESCWLMWRI